VKGETRNCRNGFLKCVKQSSVLTCAETGAAKPINGCDHKLIKMSPEIFLIFYDLDGGAGHLFRTMVPFNDVGQPLPKRKKRRDPGTRHRSIDARIDRRGGGDDASKRRHGNSWQVLIMSHLHPLSIKYIQLKADASHATVTSLFTDDIKTIKFDGISLNIPYLHYF
jgi:hypothetical protein